MKNFLRRIHAWYWNSFKDPYKNCIPEKCLKCGGPFLFECHHCQALMEDAWYEQWQREEKERLKKEAEEAVRGFFDEYPI